ncbi:hypothetical protein GQ43DRAFT_80021 [Delitschia confertaspora ATCC 74209]|uniref:Uncharacterized protein n=1 Tax=Delitschia confertaspora ATCC 74209 TaxID=1513339 RepID=A0A9P4JJJ0_9PLEO|nr:hypothetical protein GQ43DRAFT_80021 [Delitschia confertaspora ATCC 74209]
MSDQHNGPPSYYHPPAGPPPGHQQQPSHSPVQQQQPYHPSAQQNTYSLAPEHHQSPEHNPWQQQPSSYQHQQPAGPLDQHLPQFEQPPRSSSPYQQHSEYAHPQSQSPYPQHSEYTQPPPNQTHPAFQQQPPHREQNQNPPLPPRTNTLNTLVPEGDDRAEQVETLQAYEAAAPPPSEHDRNQEILRREFPGIDSSLIAAIYGDSMNLAATREMLHELSSSG